ncbi:MAG: FAD/NAD(P)-binding protein [Chloroflexi bacterium]|nr:FAD/NAD(P)-binding protein [Chloroflexota bacterium]
MKLANDPHLYTPITMRIIAKRDLCPDVRFFQMVPAGEFKQVKIDYKPGQFMMLSAFGAGEGPFSISSPPSRKGIIEFGIRKAGKVTEKLFTLRDGDTVGLRGPFGNGFPIEKMLGKDLIIVAGGLGVVPLRSLILYALDNRESFGRIIFIYGFKNVEEMLFNEVLLEMLDSDQIELYLTADKCEVKDDKYKGRICEGQVTGIFKDLKNIDPGRTVAAVCGPPVMYKFVVDKLLEFNIGKNNIFLSLERRMKCGVGKCGHCSIDYIYTCMEGPVFSYWDVIHMRDLI